MSLELQEANHCDDFKKSDIKIVLLHYFENSVTCLDNILHRAQLSIDGEPLSKGADMWRYEHSNLEAHLLERSRDLDRYTPFSIGTGDMYKFEITFVWISKVLSDTEHLVEI